MRSIPSFQYSEVTGSVTTQGTSPSSAQKYHPRTSTLFYQRWAGQKSLIPCIPLTFHYEVSLWCSGGCLVADETIDQTLPDHLPPSATLRTIFTRYLNINAVPRYGFFEILHHFAENSLEKEKLQEFITPEGAVRFQTTPLKLVRIRAHLPHHRMTSTSTHRWCAGRSKRSWKSSVP